MTGEALSGRLLVASPLLVEPTFLRTVVVVLEHGGDAGAIGVVLNRPLPAEVADVVPAAAALVAEPAVLFDGGPVGPTTAIALGLPRPGAPAAGWAPSAAPFATVDLDADPGVLSAGLRRLRVFAGYAGWGRGQLEGEIAAGAWYVVDSLPDDVFTADPGGLWRAVLRRQGWPLAAVATCPLDPRLN